MSGLEAGSTLGGYSILARIRAGAMGVLYLAQKMGPAGFARPVAIKVIHEHLAQNKRFCRMFIAEAKLSARIEDPHVVRVEEFGEADGRYYLVMEFVHGVSLAQALAILRKRGGLPVDVAVAIAMDIASGLHAAHEATDEDGQPLGIVHRDVSPHNVLVSYKGYVKVIDFGIAKAIKSAGQTLTGSIRGKLAYMPPEQARSAKHVDRRADLYALGLILWEMLAGRRMFTGKNDIALLNQIRSPVIVAPSTVNPRVPKKLDDVVLRLLEQDREKRPPTGATVARMLAEAWPAAAKVLAADIAAAMKAVRDAATATATGAALAAAVTPRDADTAEAETKSGGGDEGEDEDDAALYGEEVRKGVTLLQGVQANLDDADQGTAALSSNRDVTARAIEDDEDRQNKTKVMTVPPMARRQAVMPETPTPPAELKRTFRMDGAAVASAVAAPVYDEVTKSHTVQKRPGASGIVPVVSPPEGYISVAPPEPPPQAPEPPPAKVPAWLSAPVMLLLTVVAVALLAATAMQCGRTSADSARASAATAGTANRSRSPLENAREAALEGNPQAVRSYLEKQVRAGKSTDTEEVKLVLAACMQMGDRRCVDEVSKKYPSVPRPSGLLP